MATAPTNTKQTTVTTTTTVTSGSTAHLNANLASKANESYKQKPSLSAAMEKAVQLKKQEAEREYRHSLDHDESEIDLSFSSTKTPPEIVIAVLRNHNIDFNEHNRIMHVAHANYFTLVDDRETDLEKKYRSFPISLKSIKPTTPEISETLSETFEKLETPLETEHIETPVQIPITTVSHETIPTEPIVPIVSPVITPVVSQETTTTNTLGTVNMTAPVPVVTPIPEIPAGESILTYEIPVTVSQPIASASVEALPVVKPLEQTVITPVTPAPLPENPTPESILMYEIPVTIHPDVIQNVPTAVSHETVAPVVPSPIPTTTESSFMVSPFEEPQTSSGKQPEQKIPAPESVITKASSDIETARIAYGREWEAYQKNLYDMGSQGTRQQLFGSAGNRAPNLFPATDAYQHARETTIAELKTQGKNITDIIEWIHQETDKTIGLLGEKKRQAYIKLANKFGLISVVPVNNFNLNIADTTTNHHEIISNKLGLGIAALDKPYVIAAQKLFTIAFPEIPSLQPESKVVTSVIEKSITSEVSPRMNHKEFYDKVSHAVLQVLFPTPQQEPKPVEIKPLSFNSGKPKSEPEELFA
jgi:hypothetical protein